MEFENAVIAETYPNAETAEAAVSLLQSEGIEAIVRADDAGGELPNLDLARGARVFVSRENLERARELLNAGLKEEESPA